MKNYKIMIQYDGSRYNGWQKQGNTQNTIQQKIEEVLSEISGTQTILYGAGRTDAGTHAKGQTANFNMETKLEDKTLFDSINALLPEDIGVISLKEAPMRFHSRLNAKGKKYLYRVWNGPYSNVFERRYVYSVMQKYDIEAMQEAASYFIGEHDFKSFCSNKRFKKSTVRTIYDIKITEEKGEIKFLFYGNGFLYHMVRILVGTLLEVGEKKRSPKEMQQILSHKNRMSAGITVPPCGLTLMEVIY